MLRTCGERQLLQVIIMDVNKGYVRKIISDIGESIEAILNYTSKPYEKMSEAKRYAVRYNIIVVAEAISASAVRFARRLYNEEPETPAYALSILRDRSLLIGFEYEDLIRLVRLRNLLVHRYWIIDDEKIYTSIKNNFKSVGNLLERLRRYVD